MDEVTRALLLWLRSWLPLEWRGGRLRRVSARRRKHMRACARVMWRTREVRIPVLPVDPDAEARVDAWCREHEQPRVGRPITRRMTR